MKYYTFSILFALFAFHANGQHNNSELPTSINATGTAPDASAMLDVQSTTKGILVPRMSTAQKLAIPSPARGLLVYDTDLNQFCFYIPSIGTGNWVTLISDIPISTQISDADSDTKIVTEALPDEDLIHMITQGQEVLLLSTDVVTINTTTDLLIGDNRFGAGEKLLYDASNNALRFGSIDGTQWDPVNIGSNSFAHGIQTIASAERSTAWGSTTSATGIDGTAWGAGSIAAGQRSTAWGSTTRANGNFSTSWGGGATAGGVYSTAWGINTTASESTSTAWGDNTLASGEYSTAWGRDNTSAAERSTAWGLDNNATGAGSTSWGSGNLSSGIQSSAWGLTNESSGVNSTSWGVRNNATGTNSTAWGDESTAEGSNSTAWGSFNMATATGSTAWGDGCVSSGLYTTCWGEANSATFPRATVWGLENTAGGNNATAWGSGNEATGIQSTAWGAANISSGELSTTWGGENQASALTATAWGAFCTASGDNATSWGDRTTASGTDATSWGSSTTASGVRSTAWGKNNFASGRFATAWGNNNKAESFAETSLGQFGTMEVSFSIDTWVPEDRLFTIGNGTADGDRSDAVRIYKNGKSTFSEGLGIGRDAELHALEVAGKASKDEPGAWIGHSDLRLKKNITSISSQEALSQILKMQGVTYEWNDNVTGIQRTEGVRTGFVAQDIQQLFPERVKADKQGYLQTAYGEFDPLFVEAFKAQQEEISKLQDQVKALNGQLMEVRKFNKRLLELEESLISKK